MDPFDDIVAIDIETASWQSIKTAGAWPYSLHPSTIVYCLAWGQRHGEEHGVWFPGDDIPAVLVEYIRAGGLLLAHNVAFERAIWENILVPGFGWPEAPVEQWRDTQIIARYFGLPMTLDGLARTVGASVKKDVAGGKIMKEMASPPKGVEVRGPDTWVYPLATEENLERLADYCLTDVSATIHSYVRMQPLPLAEQRVAQVDRKINERGMHIDVALARSMAKLARERRETLNAFVSERTFSKLTPVQLKEWVKSRGVTLPKVTRKKADGTFHKTESLDRVAIAGVLEDHTIDPLLRLVLENRREAGKATSLAKLKRVAQMLGPDHRLRNALQYCGAHTGRWSSYGLQVHNLPKIKMSPEQADLVRTGIQMESLEVLQWAHRRPLEALSQSLRLLVSAPEGRELIAADYSAIEARVVAWLSGQDDIVQRFAAGEDVYVYNAQTIEAAVPEIEEVTRDLGKVATLALGYGMGDLRFAETANAAGVYLPLKLARKVKIAWRGANKHIVNFWAALEECAKAAIGEPGSVFRVGPHILLQYQSKVNVLAVRLPSGRCLFYWAPRLVRAVKTIKIVTDEGAIVEAEMKRVELRFQTMNEKKDGMTVESTYGGKLAENVTQAVARDVLAEALVRFDKTPYDVVLHVHDSIAAEVDEGTGSVDEFCYIMSESPAWAHGLPIAVEGYRDKRFRG